MEMCIHFNLFNVLYNNVNTEYDAHFITITNYLEKIIL